MHASEGRRLREWLEAQGLARYAEAFVAAEVDLALLPTLNDADLKELGVALGDRKRLQAAIAGLGLGFARNAAEASRRVSRQAENAKTDRRQLTVMFCDLVGSTELSTRLDPEDLLDVIRRYQAIVTEVIARHEGFIARYMGDGVLVYFGYPAAHEDAAERAVRAGLDLLQSLAGLRSSGGDEVMARLGVATGTVVVGDVIGHGVSEEIAVTGQVPNLAARVLSVAEPGTLAIADGTKRLVRGLFRYRDLGPQRLKGIAEEVTVWQVLGEATHETRFAALHEAEPADAFFGRDAELATLERCWQRALAGEGQVVLLSGEAGIGKSSLLQRFAEPLGRPAVVRVRLQCSARHGDSPLHPLIVHLRHVAGFEPEDTPEARILKIERMVPEAMRQSGVPLLARLLSTPGGERYAAAPLPAPLQKARTLALLVELALVIARRKPMLMLLEDAHWMDPTTEELTLRLLDALPGSRMLFVLSTRPEYSPPWKTRPQVSRLALARLGPQEVARLVSRLAGAVPLAPQTQRQILAKADGIPLFAEELTKAVLEAGDAAHAAPVPATLQDSLMARLDRLGEIKDVAQVGAAIGRRFSLDMLAAVMQRDAAQLAAALQGLARAGLILRRAGAASKEYGFKHALLQDAAYESLLRTERRSLHARIAQVLEDGFPAIVAAEPETLAHHWGSAGAGEKAAGYWLRAGQRAVAGSANVEAIRHLSNGIALLPALPAGPARSLLEFGLHLALGQACYVVKGPAAPETTRSFAYAQDLVESVHDTTQRYALLYGIFSGYHFAARFDLAEPVARRMLELAQRDGDDAFLCQAHRMFGYLGFFRGEAPRALQHFDELTRRYRPDPHARMAALFGADCRVAAHGFQLVLESMAGLSATALRRARDNLAYARGLGHPATIGWAYASAGYMHYFLRDAAAAAAITREGALYCEANDVGSWAVHCRVFNAWAEAQRGDPAAQVEGMSGLLRHAGAGNALGLPLLRGLLAEVLLAAGRVPEALQQAETALAEIEATAQHVFAPSVELIRAECLAGAGAGDGAPVRDGLQRAEASARRTGARLLALRAALRLAHLCGASPDGEQRRRTLAVLCGEFEEGRELADWRAAQMLLAPRN